MDGSQVSFGRRGLPSKPTSSAPASFGQSHAETGHGAIRDVAPDMVIERSLSKLVMFIGAIWLVIFLTAGHTKYSNDLPFWMRPDAQFYLRNYLFPFAFCSIVTALTLGPALRRPIALKLYDDHFEFLPLIGKPRIIRWSTVGDITQSRWDKYKTIYVEVSGAKRVAIYTNHLTRSRDEIASLLEYSRGHTCFRQLHLSGEPVDGRYMLPGH